MKHALLFLVAVGLILSGLIAPVSTTHAQTSCFAWSNQNGMSLQQAIDMYTCVEIQPRSQQPYVISAPVTVQAGRILKGKAGFRDSTIVKASTSSWASNGNEAVVQTTVNGTSVVTISGFTIDGSGVSTYGVGQRYFTADGMRIKNAKCTGIGIAGLQVTAQNNIIEFNGAGCIAVPPGAGIYATGPDIDPGPGEIIDARSYNPSITGNTIENNTGPALDVNAVWGGVFSGNTVRTNNAGWAAVSLFGASDWIVENNYIHHPDTLGGNPYHPSCKGGPNDSQGHSAAIFLCQVSDENNNYTVRNIIRNNQVLSWYGILSIGNDEAQPYWAPRNNTFSNNTVLLGTSVPWADDFLPGQWFSDVNTWSGNKNTNGTVIAPSYF